MLFGQRQHCGGLKESLQTATYITEEEFKEKTKYYNYYCYDERCNQILFIKNPLFAKNNEPTWLFIEIDKEQ